MPRLLIAFLIALLPSPATAAAAAGPPNVILIVTDDQGYGDLGATGNPVIRTPNIDELAAGSASMTTFYVSPVCAPTRASLMTGRYNYRTRVVDTWIGRAMMEPDEVTVAEVLRDAGYATGIFGKWHLGDCYPMRAMDQGFETSLVHRGGGIGQPSDPAGGERKYTDAVLFRDGERVETTGYCTDVYFDAAAEWIASAHESGAPFFAYIATNAPHGPFHDVPKDLYDAYAATDLGNAAFPQAPGHPLPLETNEDRRARIFAMITNIDDNVGRIMARLDELGQRENTLVVFMVDNGPNGRRFVAGMRGQKGEVYEGGIRSPFFAHWPARLTPGVSSDRVAAHIDVMPTILDACGVAPPGGIALDGRSVLPLLEGRDVDWPDRPIVIQSHRGNEPRRYHHVAVRTRGWKLVHPSGFGRESFDGEPAFELYDMRADPLEEHDVSSVRPAMVERLRAAYDAWFDDVSRTRSDNYAPPRIHLGSPREPRTVLTRQDWRQLVGRGWGDYSLGRWLVRVERPGPYTIACVLHRVPEEATTATLELNGTRYTRPVEAGATNVVFDDVELPVGPGGLVVTIGHGASLVGPLRVAVTANEQPGE